MASRKAQNSASPPGKPWAKGVSGNPGGRRRMPEEVKKILADAAPEVAKALVATAKNRKSRDHVKAAIHVMDRVYGKVPDKIQHSGDGGGPITLAALKDLSDEELVARATAVIEERRAGVETELENLLPEHTKAIAEKLKP